MPLFTLTKRALDDLREIGRYTQGRWGREQRRTYLVQLDGCFRALAENPNQGERFDRLRPGYRKYPTGRPRHLLSHAEYRHDRNRARLA